MRTHDHFFLLALLLVACCHAAASECSDGCIWNGAVYDACIADCDSCLQQTPPGCSTFFTGYFNVSDGQYLYDNCHWTCPMPWWAWLLIALGCLLAIVALLALLVHYCWTRRRAGEATPALPQKSAPQDHY